MKFLKIAAACLAACTASLFSSAATSATLVVDANGVLTGANGVSVNGSLFDVRFVDGTCSGLYGGCDNLSDFPFTVEAAQIAAASLLELVFIDGPQGLFDSNPALVNGCQSSFTCNAFIPVGFTPTQNVAIVSASNRSANSGMPDVTQVNLNSQLTATFDTSPATASTFAIFTPSVAAAVPEPATWAMMIGGFGLAGAAMRRRTRPSATLA